MGGLWGWSKSHRGFEPSLYFHSDKIFPCGFKGIGAEYLMNCVALSFPHICLLLAAAMLGSSLAFAWCGCFLPASFLPPGIFEYLQSCHGLVSLGWCREGFLFRLCRSLSFSLSGPRLSCVEECVAPGFSSALSSSIYQWGKENTVFGSDPELKVLFSPWQQ